MSATNPLLFFYCFKNIELAFCRSTHCVLEFGTYCKWMKLLLWYDMNVIGYTEDNCVTLLKGQRKLAINA